MATRPRPLTKVTDIIVHCTANRPGCKMTMADFRKLHRSKGWYDVGYHYIVFEDGRVEKGRDITLQGSHCIARGMNTRSISIAYVGGLDAKGTTADTRTPEQKASLAQLITDLVRRYRCTVHGHRDYERGKVCPCFDAYTEYLPLVTRLNKELCTPKSSLPSPPPLP